MRGLVSSATFTGTAALRDATQRPSRLVVAFLGDSITYGGGPTVDYAMGYRLPFQRYLSENGVRFRCVGRGFGALNGAGTTGGRNPNVADFHDSPIYTPQDVRHDGYSGYRLDFVAPITNVNTSTGFITAPNNGLTSGETVVFASTGDPITFSVSQPVYWVTNVGGAGAGTFQVAQYDGGSTALTITSAGTGSRSLAIGLIQMLPSLVQNWDEAPTDIIVGGGTNDVIQMIGAGTSVADTLAALKVFEDTWESTIDTYAPSARKYRATMTRFYSGAVNFAACTEVVDGFNAWLRDTQIYRKGRLWTLVDVSADIGNTAILDGVHPTRAGYNTMGTKLARAVVQAVGSGHATDRAPREIIKRPAQACVELSATTHRITIPTQATLAPGSNSFFYAIDYMPFSLPSGANVIVCQENPYQDGGMVVHNAGRIGVYWRNAGLTIQTNAYTTVMQMYRWHQIFVFHDFAKQQAVVFCNGRYLQRVHTSAAAVTAQDGWSIGGISGSLASALGLYQRFLMGHGASLSIEDAADMAADYYYRAKEPVGTTARYPLNEGTGTAIAGTVIGSTAGTLSGGSWVASGLYRQPWNEGYERIRFYSRTANVTTTYTATYGELVKCDPSGAAFTVNLPTAVGHDGERIALKNMTSSTNVVTLDGNASETIDRSATISGLSTADGYREIEARAGAWVTVAVA